MQVTAVIPFYPYSRQPDAPYKKFQLAPHRKNERSRALLSDLMAGHTTPSAAGATIGGGVARKDGYKLWAARNGKLVANMMTAAGTARHDTVSQRLCFSHV